MKHPLRVVAVLAALVLAACGGRATGGIDVAVDDVWARSSPSMAMAGAAYMTLTNGGDVDDALVEVAVSDTVAGRAELHETRPVGEGDGDGDHDGEGHGHDDDAHGDDHGSMMEMVHVDRIPIPAGETVHLEPGGFHVMLLELAAPLEAGSEFELTLTFAEAGEVTVTAVVGDGAP